VIDIIHGPLVYVLHISEQGQAVKLYQADATVASLSWFIFMQMISF